ncbi:MAG: hypothetical protein OEV94_07280 [Deltaproteobacteria bacterium]|nr:hypothetical protein [Deltaproteobacteria bacterium]
MPIHELTEQDRDPDDSAPRPAKQTLPPAKRQASNLSGSAQQAAGTPQKAAKPAPGAGTSELTGFFEKLTALRPAWAKPKSSAAAEPIPDPEHLASRWEQALRGRTGSAMRPATPSVEPAVADISPPKLSSDAITPLASTALQNPTEFLPPGKKWRGDKKALGLPGLRLPRLVKFAMLGIMLFGLGLGGVMLALLPPGAPNPWEASPLAPSVGADWSATALPATDGTGASAENPFFLADAPAFPQEGVGEKPEESHLPPVESGADAVAAPAPVLTSAAKPSAGKPSAGSSQPVSATTGPVAEPVAQTQPAAKASAKPTSSPDKPKASASKPAVPAPGYNPSAGGSYALQVGACTSDACRDRYLALLKGRVAPAQIKVQTQPDGKGKPMHRIRIEHLTQAEAQTLKKKLQEYHYLFQEVYLVPQP